MLYLQGHPILCYGCTILCNPILASTAPLTRSGIQQDIASFNPDGTPNQSRPSLALSPVHSNRICSTYCEIHQTLNLANHASAIARDLHSPLMKLHYKRGWNYLCSQKIFIKTDELHFPENQWIEMAVKLRPQIWRFCPWYARFFSEKRIATQHNVETRIMA